MRSQNFPPNRKLFLFSLPKKNTKTIGNMCERKNQNQNSDARVGNTRLFEVL